MELTNIKSRGFTWFESLLYSQKKRFMTPFFRVWKVGHWFFRISPSYESTTTERSPSSFWWKSVFPQRRAKWEAVTQYRIFLDLSPFLSFSLGSAVAQNFHARVKKTKREERKTMALSYLHILDCLILFRWISIGIGSLPTMKEKVSRIG